MKTKGLTQIEIQEMMDRVIKVMDDNLHQAVIQAGATEGLIFLRNRHDDTCCVHFGGKEGADVQKIIDALRDQLAVAEMHLAAQEGSKH